MTKHHMGKLLSLGACIGALTLTACPKDTDTDSTTIVADTGEEDPETSGGDKGSGEMGEAEAGDGDGDPVSFVPDNDIIDAATCDPWAQDCPEGEKCAAYNQGGDTWDSNKCVPLMGTGQTGDSCTYQGSVQGTDDCDVGFMCYYTNEEAIGSCIPLCTGSPDDPICDAQFNCSISNEGSLILCVYACDALLQDCEQEGTGCFWDGTQFNCDPAVGDIPTGEPCAYINDCDPGNICLDAEVLPDCAGAACCGGICDLSDPVCLINGTECVAFYDDGTAPPGQENVGVCILPGA